MFLLLITNYVRTVELARRFARVDVLQAGNKQANAKYRWKTYAIFMVIVMLFSLNLIGCQNTTGSQKLETRQGFYLDTAIAISISSERAEAILDECMKICSEKELIFSKTLENSELYQINHRATDTLTISEDMARVIETGLEFYEISEGMLDITMAPVSALWDFKSEEPKIPEAESISEALTHVDISSVQLDGNTLSFKRADTQIDLGSICKGVYC